MKHCIVLGVIGADIHAVGNRILDHFFTEAGFKVVNIGVLCSQEEFINAAKEHHASAILVSSLYGHGEIDCRWLREKCEEAGLQNILLYIGGNLMVGKHSFPTIEKRFLEMGFDRVYDAQVPLSVAVRDLFDDLEVKKHSSNA